MENRIKQSAELRKRAEAALREEPPENIATLSPEEFRKFFYDLRVNQIELEMQNEELHRTQAKLDVSWKRYFDFYNLAPVGYWTISEKGLILEANLTAASFLGFTRSELINQPITHFFHQQDQDIFYLFCKKLLGSDAPQNCDLRVIRKDGTVLWVQLNAITAHNTDGSGTYQFVISDISERKQAEEALLKAGALQSAIFNSANFSSIATDAKGVIQIFNVGAERMLGYTAADVLNTITPADISDPQEVIARAAALSIELETPITPGFEALVFKASRGIEDIYELTYIRKDGSRFPAVVSVTALRDEGEAIIGYLLIGTDNTARKQAEAALRKAGALQSAIFNSANFSSIATDARGVIQIFNVGAEQMLGYTAAEVMNTITPVDISDPQEVIARAAALSIELGTPITPGFEALVFKASRGIEDIYELTYIRKDGSRFPAVVSVTALRDEGEAIIGYLLIGTDNTARKQLEEAVLASTQLVRTTLDSLSANIAILDENGSILLVNKAWRDFAEHNGLSADCVSEGNNYLQICEGSRGKNSEEASTFADGIRAVLLGMEKSFVLEYPCHSPHEKRWFIGRVTPFPDGGPHNVVVAHFDMTDRKNMEVALQDINHQLEAAVESSRAMTAKAQAATIAKSRFLANMSHEIRTPLNAILGFSQLMQNDLTLSYPQKNRIEIINRNGTHLLGLLNDILELSKIEAGHQVLVPTAFDLQLLLSDLVPIFRQRAESRNLTFTADSMDRTACYIITDEQRLRQVLTNLLDNAVKFTSTGGVELSARIEPAEQGELRLVVLVEDSGPGIEAEEMGQLFVAFEQGRSGRQTSKGTGLGLNISRQFARMMGGDITVTSEVGKGSVFRVEILAREGTEVSAPPKIDYRRILRLEEGSLPFRVLVVDDMDDDRTLVVQQLDQAGFEVQPAASGIEAVAMFPSWCPHLILMDQRMPGMHGNEAIRHIRRSPGGDLVKIITLTGDATDKVRDDTLKAGADDFMTKPFRLRELLNTIGLLTGARYVFAESDQREDPRAKLPIPILREMMNALPEDFRREILEAAVSCRQDHLLKLLKQAADIDPEGKGMLQDLVAKFDYPTIIELLN